jgi:non-ribosomal peptide synthetase component E (peptide arylation enzyme)
MKADAVPEFRAQIEAAAAALKNSPNDHVLIEGADNKILVKSGSNIAKRMIEENMLLFPQIIDGNHYLVCIASRR